MTGSLLLRGMLVGMFAGLVAFGFARIFGEPSVDRAIAFEGSHAAAPVPGAHTHSHEAGAAPHSHAAAEADEEVFSRSTQSGIGLFTGVVVYGAAIGGIFALVFAFAQGRLGSFGPRGTAALIALAAFVALALVPWLKYPANPPSVGNAATIGPRTALYFSFMAISVAALAVSIWLSQGWRTRLGTWNAGLAGAALFIVIASVAGLVLPAVDEVPEGFSAGLLWQFRLASLGIQLVLWTVIGLGFGALVERTYAGARSSSAAPGLPHRAF